MIEHAPILQIIIPLLSAPLAVLSGRRDVAWLIAMLATIASFFLSVHLFLH